MENTNIAAKSVKDLKYAFMAGKNLTAKIAEDPKYALMTGKGKHAKSAKEVKYAPMTGKSKHAKSAEGPKSAFITGKRKPAKSAEDPKSALMTGESEPVRSAVTRLKLASNNGLLVDGNTIRSAIFMTQTDLSTSAFLKGSLKDYKQCYYGDCKDADGLGPVNLQYTEYQDDLASIERLDNSIGHIKSNCVLCCLKCNKSNKSEKKAALMRQLNLFELNDSSQ